MKTVYNTVILGFGNHAAIEIPAKNLKEIGGSKRAPLKITVNGHTYQSTATTMDGKSLVVFPMRERLASGVASGDRVKITLELDSGYRKVIVPAQLATALKANGLTRLFRDLNYSNRKEFARQVTDAKSEETKARRILKILETLNKMVK